MEKCIVDKNQANEIKNRFKLNQDGLLYHPFTCGNDSSHSVLNVEIKEENEDEFLVYLYCENCDYIQYNVPKIICS